jgi:AraC-like DNA-binding protein
MSADHVTVPQVSRVPQPLRLVELLRRFLDDQENARLEPNYASVLVKLMLLEVASQVGDPQSEAPQQRRKLAAIAQTALGKRFREPITTSEIARTLHCNPDYLGRVYRETFGYSLTTGIHRVRMHHAKNLLLLSSLTVKEVSLACGYENPDYFRRMFRRFFDMQPNQFRLLHPQQHTNATWGAPARNDKWQMTKKARLKYEAGAKLDVLDLVKQLDAVAVEAALLICHLSFVISNRRPLSRLTTFYRG